MANKISDVRVLSCVLVFIFSLILVSASVGENITQEISVGGRNYTSADDGSNLSNQTLNGVDALKINGGGLLYEIDVSEYQPWISSMKIGVTHSHADRNEAIRGGVWAHFKAKNTNGSYYYQTDLTNTSTTTSSTTWCENITSPNSYIESKDDGGYKLTVRVYAKKGITDHAEAYLYNIRVELHLAYGYNALQIASPGFIDYGQVDLGVATINKTISISNIGPGTTSLGWQIDSTKTSTPTWIKGIAKRWVTAGATDTINLDIDTTKVDSTNVKQLSEKLIPIFDTINPSSNGLRGEFYHVPGGGLSSLDVALSSPNKKLVYSDIFTSIEFNKGSATESLGANELFKSGTKPANVRKNFIAIFTGFIKIETTGTQTFYVTHDDGARLRIYKNGAWTNIINKQNWSSATDSGTINLDVGIYPIELAYFQGGGPKNLTLQWIPAAGGTQAAVPSSVLYNGMNVLIRAQPKKPTVSITNTKIENKVQVTVNKSVIFTATGLPGSTNVSISEYKWKSVSGSPVDDGAGYTSGQYTKSMTFTDPGDYTVYCKSVDAKGVESNATSVPVRAWNQPTVNDTPPTTAMPPPDPIAGNAKVSWYNVKYVGVVGQPVYLMAAGALGTGNLTGESITKFKWDTNNDWANVEINQNNNQRVSYTWNSAAGGQIGCKAETNYGIESNEKKFNLKIYDQVQAEADGPYNGRPNRNVELRGTINTTSYAGASFAYQWYVKIGTTWTAITTGSDGKASYLWTAEGDYEVKFGATVVTAEGLQLSGNDTALVHIEAGMPTSMPGGPYRGGIAGGNFSPIGVIGNSPDFIEAEDIGKIIDWEWIFDHGPDTNSGGEFKAALTENVDSMISVLTLGNATLEKSAGDVNSGESALRVINTGVDNQRYSSSIPGWSFNVVASPKAANEFRYITFAWRKNSGTGIMIQLYGNGSWEHRYNAGASKWTSKQVSVGIPVKWEIVTRDLYADFGTLTITGIAFTPYDGIAAYYDDLYFHKSPTPPIGFMRGNDVATQAYSKKGKYQASLRVKSEFGKWSYVDTADVQVIDGEIAGYVRAADLRTPVKNATLTLTSSHVDTNVLSLIADADPLLLTTTDKSGITTTTDANGHYSFKGIPLGSYRIIASKVDGTTIHEFQNNGIMGTELTLDAPNQIAIDFVDLSVFPISGRIVYSIQKNGMDVLVDGVEIEAQAVGSTNSIKALLSTRSGQGATGGNYNLPLFSGRYLFLATRQGHDVRIKTTIPDYDTGTGLVNIDRARTDIDFVDYTERELTVFVQDSGGYKVTNRNASVSGDNGQATGKSDVTDGKLVAKLPPGIYTITVPGAQPETKEIDLTAGDQSVIMTIPVKIVVSISASPKLFDVSADFLAQFGLTPDDNPAGYMYYYPPEPRTHLYTISATANGNPVADFNLFIADEVSMTTEDPPEEQGLSAQGKDTQYIMTAGLPKKDTTFNPPLAAPKRITFRAEKDGYLDSDIVVDQVTILGDLLSGTAESIVSVPVVNYTVLHDPPGDKSSSSLDDSMTVKGIVSGMTMTIGNSNVPVYPSPWSDERTVAGFKFNKDPGSGSSSSDLGTKGLIGSDRTLTPSAGAFTIAAAFEAVTGFIVLLTGPLAPLIQLAKLPILAVSLEAGTAIPGSTGVVQYEVNASRKLQTPSDGSPDLVGPGKGDIYYGEGWTLGLQNKYRMGIQLIVDNSGNPILDSKGNKQWKLYTESIMTYDILERTNQYIYTTRDIENLIADLEKAISQATDEGEKTKLSKAKTTWQNLLEKNLSYVWNRDYVSQGLSFEQFKSDKGSELSDENSETLIFSAGPSFEYSRKISESITTKFSYEIGLKTAAGTEYGFEAEIGFKAWGTGTSMKWNDTGEYSIETGPSYGAEWESGKSAEQTVGFTLSDDDVGDNISTRVYADPVWGTPIFFQDAGSYTSDPWEPGTNKGVDFTLELVEQPSQTFDYREGAHYKLKVQYTGQKELAVGATDFVMYPFVPDSPDSMTTKINGSPAPYNFFLAKSYPTAEFTVSLYPPEKDWNNSEEKEYSVVIEVDETADSYQIYRVITLKPKFADLRAPRAIITAPYNGERVSPVFFSTTKPFNIEVFSNDEDLAKIQLQIRAKQPNGVWEKWRNLSGMLWEAGKTNANVELLKRLNQSPKRYEFTFKWTDVEIKQLGVGEYAISAVATDKATTPNMDTDPPAVVFLVDDSKPTVLTSIPDYQARESERIYRGELSVIFTDDMRADDFSDRTFYVTDLLKSGEKVAGFVSYSPALRKAIFVPIAPFKSNGFYRAEVKTDTETEKGVHDLAGNPLDNAFMWTFRTTDAPFEPTWSIMLSASDGTNIDSNNIAGVEYGALDSEDEKDASSVPALVSRMSLSFLDRAMTEFDRDVRPADGRLSHSWFFAISDAVNGSTVTIKWRPSLKLTKTDRQYQYIRLIEFNLDGSVKQIILLDPTLSQMDPNTGLMKELVAYTYTNGGESSRYFRLDVMKSDFVATNFVVGTSKWKFFSVPIIPQRDDPFVNLGDDIDPLQVYRYDTQTNGYKVYPLDMGEVSIQTGRGYFTRLGSTNVEVDVGGVSNLVDVQYNLASVGWYAIGNPFIMPVNVANLKFNGVSFDSAVTNGLIEGTLYRWKIDNVNPDAYDAVTSAKQLTPWEGYWLKTKQANISITIPAPAGIGGAIAPLPSSFSPPIPNLAPPIQSDPIVKYQLELRFELVGRDALGNPYASDVTTALGTYENAMIGLDAFDQSEPPTLAQTVSAYFDHSDWGSDSGLYNSDYQTMLKAGEERIWTLTVYTKRPDARMTLSWEKTISYAPGDIMLYFRRIDNNSSGSEWQDMRKTRFAEIVSNSQTTKAQFEVRAVRFDMTPPSDVRVNAGEKLVTIQWTPSESEFIIGYVITRQDGSSESWKDDKGVNNLVPQSSIPSLKFVDSGVEEDKTYTYQISTQFKTDMELKSKLFTIRVNPMIRQTSLLQNYPNPFNPETWIPYQLKEVSDVKIRIYTLSGELVREFALGYKPSGLYISRDKAIYWDGRNESGESVASGAYFYSIQAGNYVAIKKMIVAK
jgi:hypothetical protein